MTAILACAEGDPFGIGIWRARVARGARERMVAEALARGLHKRARHALHQRLVGIVELALALENVAARNNLATQIAGLPRDAAQLLEPVVVRLELVIGDREVFDRHLGRDCASSVALGEMSSKLVVTRQDAPREPVPVRTGAAQACARQERAEAPDRQRRLGGRMPQRHGFHLAVLKQLLRTAYLRSSRTPGSAKSSRAVRFGPRSSPTTLRPTLVNSRARMLPVQPTPITTASTSLRIVVMAASPYEKSAIERGGLSYFLPKYVLMSSL